VAWVKQWAAAILACALVAVSPASAQPADADETTDTNVRQEAKERLHEGVKAYSGGRFKDAVDLFLAANRLVPSPALSFNIAKAYEKLGDNAAALAWYRDYLRRAPGASDRSQVDKIIARYEAELRDKGVQQVTVLSTPKRATVVIDGQPVGVTPWTGELAPGKHTVTGQLRGYRDTVIEFDLAADRAIDVSLTLEVEAKRSSESSDDWGDTPALSGGSASQSDEPAADRGGIRLPTWVAFGIGGAALATALGFELARRSAEDDARAAPTQVGAREAYDTMQERRTMARISGGVGGAAVVIGAVLLVVDLSRSSDATTSARYGFVAGCSGQECAMAAKGSFR
jgi:tetratricopeptide (TPR) repeat protein